MFHYRWSPCIGSRLRPLPRIVWKSATRFGDSERHGRETCEAEVKRCPSANCTCKANSIINLIHDLHHLSTIRVYLCVRSAQIILLSLSKSTFLLCAYMVCIVSRLTCVCVCACVTYTGGGIPTAAQRNVFSRKRVVSSMWMLPMSGLPVAACCTLR